MPVYDTKQGTLTEERIKIAHEGTLVDAIKVEFKVAREASGSFEIADGTVITLKHHVSDVYKLCDKKKEDGSPIYVLTGMVALETIVPLESKS